MVSDMKDMSLMMNQMNLLVDQQSSLLDTVECNLDCAESNIDCGIEELAYARSSYSSNWADFSDVQSQSEVHDMLDRPEKKKAITSLWGQKKKSKKKRKDLDISDLGGDGEMELLKPVVDNDYLGEDLYLVPVPNESEMTLDFDEPKESKEKEETEEEKGINY